MNKLSGFFTKDRRYVYLTGMVLAGLSALMWQRTPSRLSFLGNGAGLMAVEAVCAVFAVMAVIAFIVKLTHWKNYSGTFEKKRGMLVAAKVMFWAVALVFVLTIIDRVLLELISIAQDAAAAGKNPTSAVASMLYMSWNGRSILLYGIGMTVRIALIGTAVAFVLSILMVFLRIQKPARQDNDLVRFLKVVGSTFAKLYITVIRGTPMMVQALIFYYAGFNIFKSTGMSVTEVNNVWSVGFSGLITVSLNSTAYLAEVLRGGIESIDAGQTEAARSLGMTSWQTMYKVVFPQAVKNSIPAIGNEFIINIKDSSVLSVIGVMDLMYATTTVVGLYYKSLEMYIVAAIIYLVLTYLSSLIMKAISRKLDTPARDLPSSN